MKLILPIFLVGLLAIHKTQAAAVTTTIDIENLTADHHHEDHDHDADHDHADHHHHQDHVHDQESNENNHHHDQRDHDHNVEEGMRKFLRLYYVPTQIEKHVFVAALLMNPRSASETFMPYLSFLFKYFSMFCIYFI